MTPLQVVTVGVEAAEVVVAVVEAAEVAVHPHMVHPGHSGNKRIRLGNIRPRAVPAQ